MGALRNALLALGCVAFAACERAPSPNDEVASELRALRLALRDSRPAATDTAPQVAREAIDAAMRPLRDVLTQLGSTQRELATRQTALTQELQHWTQLVVGAMQDKQAQKGRDLQQRLEQLEQTMAQQDARHREVETLLQGALDNTATHLEDFLQRLQQLTPPTGAVPPIDDPATAPQPAPTGGGGAARDPTGEAAGTGGPGGGAGPPPAAARQGASRWPWWLLAFAAVAMGVRLLLPRRRDPLGVAPEMQAAARGDTSAVARPPATAAADVTLDEPEVEELWAAAALLGEAIGKIKQSTNPAEVERLLGGPLGELEPPAPANLSRPAPPAAALHEPELDLDDLFVLDEEEPQAEQPHVVAPVAPSPQRAVRRPIEPLFELPRITPAPRHADTPSAPRPESITCRLAVRDAPRAEATVRELLGADPRVLVQPAPEVRPSAGELCVVFALLPGLPPGERSQLEQRLRDAVA